MAGESASVILLRQKRHTPPISEQLKDILGSLLMTANVGCGYLEDAPFTSGQWGVAVMTDRPDDRPQISAALVGLLVAMASGCFIGALAVALMAWLGSSCG